MSAPLLGRCDSHGDHICHTCQGKAAKRLWRQITKRQRAREKRQWRNDQE